MNTFTHYSSSPETKLEQFSPNQHPSFPMPTQAPVAAPKPTKTKSRKRVNTAEKRHQHNAVERQRRETLNSKFFVLARLLPALAKSARPSKSAIVNGSISHLTKQRNQRLLASRLLRQLCAERDELAKECNEWRSASGYAQGRDALPASAWTDEMDEVCMVENEQFGDFDGEEGDEAEDGEEQDEENGLVAMGIEQATAAVSKFNSTAMGLITPRSSTEIDPLSLALGLGVQPSQARPIPLAQPTQPIEWPNFSFNNSTLAEAGHSSSSLPFAAFMSESPSDSPPGSLLCGIPTPPTTDFSQFTHTPSPRSSGSGSAPGSFDDKLHAHQQFPLPSAQTLFRQPQAQAQWNQADQLFFFHQLQQQQLQQKQLDELRQRGMSASGPSSTPHAGIGRSHSAGAEMFALQQHSQNVHSLAQGLPQFSAAALQMQEQQQHVQAMILQRQQQQQQQQMAVNGGQGQGMPMSRMSSEQMEAWRKLALGAGNGARPEFGQWAQNALKGY